MNHSRFWLIATALAALVALAPSVTFAQVTMEESGFLATTLAGDLGKQIEVGLADTCIYYGTMDGLKRRCAPNDPGTICDPNLTFPSGLAFSTGGSFGAFMYIADFGLGDIHRSAGCAMSTPFATLGSPGAIAFPPGGSAFGDFLYACVAYDGPIYRVSPAGVVTPWVTLPTLYLRFGPGGSWGNDLYATEFGAPGTQRIVRVSPAGAITPLATGFGIAEGFDWGFDGDMFATDVGTGQILRVKPNGTKTLFATLPGAADVAYRASEEALYVVSVQGGLYRIARSGTTAVGDEPRAVAAIAVSPNPARGACTLRFGLATAGLTRVVVVDAAGRMVRRLPETWRPAGEHALVWDGRDESGGSVPAGVYFARLSAGGEMRAARISLTR
jgi:sugar lactone lactonase YvrE